ncbi:partitioning defective protein 3 [Loa loa]|uniref:Partitioning defective protein 3 n=1 Tax=Loa loa TaxID=7209 RepID=A0A1S0UHF6_LOALO|nr:partitioning defective protein 3 [Loa loa]EJD74973.1 partitioning defective protein 3 [Loa loa]
MYHTVSTTTDTAAIGPTGIVHCQQNANYVTILAIYDEPGFAVVDSTPASASQFAINGATSSSSSSATPKTAASTESSLDSKLNIISSSNDGDIVEITNIAVPPTDGLRVTSDNAHTLQQKPSSSSVITGSGYVSPLSLPLTHFDQKRSDICRIYHSALKNVSGSPRSKYRVTISPDADCQPSQESPIFTKQSLMTRTSARKSRLTDNFFDAKERLEEKLTSNIKSRTVKGDVKNMKLIPLMEAANREQTVIILSDITINMNLGIEISPVHDPSNNMRLQAVEIRQIDDEGRVGNDGRLRIGDRIVEINQRPVYQMSISRARAYLHEMQAVAHPSLTVDRSIETFTSDTISHRSQSSTSSLQKRPIFSALQQANTTALGITFPVEIVKRSGGFGFTITSRETAKGERLFYIGTVKTDSAAVNKLRAGDRLLQINGEKTTELTQNDMVERLKKLDVGDSINLLVSRLGSQENENHSPTILKSNHDDNECCHPNEGTERYGEEILTMKIALNETGSAGLGISLKARAVMKPDGSRHDCGIFIKKVLHGGAAYKDGRLKLDDQLIGIEDIDLRRMTRNSEASNAITKCLKNLGPNASIVCLRVARKVELRRNNDFLGMRSRKSSEVHDKSRTKSGDDDIATVKNQETSNSYNADVSRGRFSSSDEHSLNANEDLDSTSSDRQKSVSEDEISHVDGSAFSRKNPARRSISEKRHLTVGNDANNTVLFQKIKHNRQMSASPNRRSLSLESTEAHRSLTLTIASAHLREPTVRDARGEQTARRGHPSTLKRAQKSRCNGYAKPSISDAEDQTSSGKHRDEPYASLPREISAASKEKRQRRKSVGSSIFSKITQRLGGSRSRDASPEKMVSFDSAESNSFVDKASRTQDHGEWNKESKSNKLISRAPPTYKPSSYDVFQLADPDCLVSEQGASGNMPFDRREQYQTAVCNNGYSGRKERNSYINRQTRNGYGNELYVQSHQQPQQQRRQQYTVHSQCYYGEQREQQQQRTTYYTGCSTNYYDAFNAWFAYSAAATHGNMPIITRRSGYPSQHIYLPTAAETVSSNRAAVRQIHHERFRSCPTQFSSSRMRTRQSIERTGPYYASGYASHSGISDF